MWVDGLGDMSAIKGVFPFPKARSPEEDAWHKGAEYILASYSVVLTTYERCSHEHARLHSGRNDAVSRDQYTASPLMKLRWLRLMCDEGHELAATGKKSDTTEESAAVQASLFISAIPAERRWVMSGTPTVGGKDVAGLEQIQRLLGFLRHREYGVGVAGEKLWSKRVITPFKKCGVFNIGSKKAKKLDLALYDTVKTQVLRTLAPLMVRHVKADVALPPPIYLPMANLVLQPLDEETCFTCMNGHKLKKNARCPKGELCPWYAYGEQSWTRRTTEGVAQQIMDVMHPARQSFRHCKKQQQLQQQHQQLWGNGGTMASSDARMRAPKAVVFSEFQNDLDLVADKLIGTQGEEAVARHWGMYRSSALSTFRNGRTSYRCCPRCGYKNGSEVKYDVCDRRLVEVLLARHGPPFRLSLDYTTQRERLWPVETERIWVVEHYAASGGDAFALPPRTEATHWQDPLGRWWRLFEPGSDFRRPLGHLSHDMCDVWVDCSVPVQTDPCLPAPEWPQHNAHAGPAPAKGGPGDVCLPAKLKGWAKCGSWRGPVRIKHGVGQTSSTERYWGCPLPWEERGVPYHSGSAQNPGGAPILRGVASQVDQLDTFLLMLCHDGSHGEMGYIQPCSYCHTCIVLEWFCSHIACTGTAAGLDLSFVTHLFLVNQIADPAIQQQVVARAHRMGATGPVVVQTLRLWPKAHGSAKSS